MADYGQATAGGYSREAPCGALVCTQASNTAWWEAGVQWSKKTVNLVAGAVAQGHPASSWPLGVQTDWAAVKEIIAYFDESQPWFAFYSTVVDWAERQQALRDFMGALGTYLESKGLKAPKAPKDIPVSAGPIESLVKLGGIAVAAYVAVNLLKASKG